MEWMLQVVDEIDDAVSTVRQYGVGLIADIGLLFAGVLGMAAICAAFAGGAEITLFTGASLMLSIAAGLKFRAAAATP
jgi:hypothetical protein